MLEKKKYEIACSKFIVHEKKKTTKTLESKVRTTLLQTFG